MAKKSIKNYARRGLSIFLSLVMVTSMLQISAFAYENQVMDGYFAVDADGVATPSTESSVTAGGFTLTKEITRQTGENEFEVTLTVETSQTVETKTSKAATVLVIDLSNSMKNGLGNSTRIAEAKKVAKAFLESYAGTDANAEQYISVVWFGSFGGVGKDWVNVAGGEDKNSYNDVYNYINRLNYLSGNDGGTNLDRGLYEALQQLEEREDIVEQKNVVLITDGVPTFRGLSDRYNSLDGSGQNGSEENNDAAKARADAIKEAGATVYTVCIAAESDVCYEGADIHVCEHCDKTRDQHVKEELCRNCGEAFDAHEHDWAPLVGTYYACPDHDWSTYSARTYYYCDASKTQQYKDKVESGDVTVGYFLSNDIASADKSYNAKTSAELEAALKAIASSIEATGMTGEGTTVTDPMGQHIDLGEVSIDGVTVEGETIIWSLDPAKATKVDRVTNDDGSTTNIYTYSITYPITLDPTQKGFEEDVYYPTNGYTYLSIPQDDGSVEKVAFLVPGVKGEIPEVNWTVEYYLQDESSIDPDVPDTYTQDGTARDMGKVELWTSVTPPSNYETRYDTEGYFFAGGDVVLEIRPDGENVMKLYYNLVTSQVTVNHFYKTDYIHADGTEVPGEYPELPQKTSVSTEKVDVEFEAIPELTYDQGNYRLDRVASDELEITVDIDPESNVINLYYSRVIDDRTPTSAQINHIYTTYGYEKQNGKYVKVIMGEPEEVVAVTIPETRATVSIDVSDEPVAGREDFELNPDLGDYEELRGNGMEFVAVADPAENVRTLYFDKVIDEREAIEVTVIHNYTKTVTVVEDGEADTVTTTASTSSTTPAYVGEKFVATEENVYGGETYVSDPNNAGKLVIDELTGDATIELYYTLVEDDLPRADLIVNHHYISFTEVTREVTEEVEEEITVDVIDPETGEVTGTTTEIVTKTVVTGTETVTEDSVDHEILGIEVNDLYVGERYTAPQIQWNGYTFHEGDSNATGVVGTDSVLDLYYYFYNEDEDERAYAEIDVHHVYTTYLETIVNGEVDTITLNDGTEIESYPAEDEELRAGDSFTAIAQPEYDGNLYEQVTDEAALGPVTLQPGTNSTIVIEYERSDSDLEATDYTVNYEYHTYVMTVGEDGVAAYGEPAIDYGTPVNGSGYVNQVVTFGDGAWPGFTASASNPATTQVLAADGNEWTFVHERYIPLEKGSVTVNHYYSVETIAINGTSTWSSSSVLGIPVEKYLGEAYTAQPVLNGYDKMDAIVDGTSFAEPYALTVSGDHVVDFHYKKVVDNSVLAPYSISHEYYLYDWNGVLISGPDADQEPDITGQGYVTTNIYASPEQTDYTLISATYNGEDLGEMSAAAYTITLQDGENNVVFVYEKTLPRDLLNVTIIHNYYEDEAAMNEGAEPLAQYRDTETGIPEGESYTAEIRNQKGYTFHSADPESLTVRVTDDADHAIILNYVRASAEYEVIHIYNRNGSEEARTSETFGGLDGDVVSAESIARVPTHGGKTYSFVSVSGDITLDADELQTITLIYNRRVSTPRPDPDPDPTPTPTPDPEPDPEPVPDPEPIEIPDEDVPLEELPDEEVPLAEVPATGDPSALWVALSTLSGFGLVGLNLTGKKREEEEDA